MAASTKARLATVWQIPPRISTSKLSELPTSTSATKVWKLSAGSPSEHQYPNHTSQNVLPGVLSGEGGSGKRGILEHIPFTDQHAQHEAKKHKHPYALFSTKKERISPSKLSMLVRILINLFHQLKGPNLSSPHTPSATSSKNTMDKSLARLPQILIQMNRKLLDHGRRKEATQKRSNSSFRGKNGTSIPRKTGDRAMSNF